jgi:hypothetical protein
VTIERVQETACVDDGWIGCGLADFYAVVTILDEEFDNEDTPETDRFEDTDNIYPNWEFSKTVDASLGSVPVRIEIWDEDGGLRFGDDHVDITEPGGSNLDVSVGLGSPCSVSGGVEGDCDASLFTTGGGDDAASVWFHISVERPPTATDLRVICMHNPIWPSPAETVTFRADARDAAGTFLAADTVELWVQDRGAPARTCSTAANCTLTGGPYPTGGVEYGCMVRHRGREVFSGWRQLQSGMPTQSPVPIL